MLPPRMHAPRLLLLPPPPRLQRHHASCRAPTPCHAAASSGRCVAPSTAYRGPHCRPNQRVAARRAARLSQAAHNARPSPPPPVPSPNQQSRLTTRCRASTSARNKLPRGRAALTHAEGPGVVPVAKIDHRAKLNATSSSACGLPPPPPYSRRTAAPAPPVACARPRFEPNGPPAALPQAGQGEPDGGHARPNMLRPRQGPGPRSPR
eukprot:350320-Chlamydomonas_euryale.AAC.12